MLIFKLVNKCQIWVCGRGWHVMYCSFTLPALKDWAMKLLTGTRSIFKFIVECVPIYAWFLQSFLSTWRLLILNSQYLIKNFRVSSLFNRIISRFWTRYETVQNEVIKEEDEIFEFRVRIFLTISFVLRSWKTFCDEYEGKRKFEKRKR